MLPTYFHFTIEQMSVDLEELVTEFCFDWRASGVVQDLAFVQTQFEHQPEVVPTERINLSVYFEECPGERFLESFRARFPDLKFHLNEEQNKDWLAGWKKSFQPFCLTSDYWIVPSWCESPVEVKYSIFIDPGMAFGTGTHATTQLASDLLVKVASEASPRSVIDVGTGTGILAILARRLGLHEITVTDLDAQARVVARENFEKNQISDIAILEYQIDAMNETYDVVIANIVDGVLLKLKPDLLRILKPGGSLILSGILKEREDAFTAPFAAQSGLRLVQQLEHDDWLGQLWQR
jgi:ribosomal protein L11 methyltransferase